MISVELDADGRPISSIAITTETEAMLQGFFEEYLAKWSVKPPACKAAILSAMTAAYRMGVAHEGHKMKETKLSYDKMAHLTGKLVAAVMEIRHASTLHDAVLLATKALAGDPMTIDEINDQRASFAYGQLALTNSYREATPEKLEELRATCRKAAGCKDA